jgi:hypothetical protein
MTAFHGSATTGYRNTGQTLQTQKIPAKNGRKERKVTKNDALTDELNEAQEYVRLESAARAAAKQGKGRYGLCDACKFRAGNVCWILARRTEITARIEECAAFDI